MMAGKRHRKWGAAIVAAAALCALGASAQQPPRVAQLKNVNGNVLVSGQAGLATGTEAQPLVNGTRIITTANSEVVIVFDNGCEVRMAENQRFDVDSGKPCALLLPHALAAPVPAIGPGLAGIIAPGLLGAGALANPGSGSGGSPPVSPN